MGIGQVLTMPLILRQQRHLPDLHDAGVAKARLPPQSADIPSGRAARPYDLGWRERLRDRPRHARADAATAALVAIAAKLYPTLAS